MKKIILVVLLVLLIPTIASSKTVYVVKVEGEIGLATQQIVSKAVERANTDGVALIIEMDTPGGRGDAMMEIIKTIDSSEVPIIVFVSPKGAIAASAGTYIAMASNLIAMAPSTSIGACEPILGYDPTTGQIIEAPEKTINFYSSYMRSLAESHERDPDEAEKFVTENLSLTPKSALEKGMIELQADNLYDLIEKADGMKLKGMEGRLDLKEVDIKILEISFKDKFIITLTNPNLAYFLITIGILGLFLGFTTPGWHVPETIGAVCLVLGIIAQGYIGFNLGGFLLIGLGILFFVIELLTPTFGLFTIAGIASFFFGSMFLFSGTGDIKDIKWVISREFYVQFRYLILITIACVAIFFVFGISKAIKLRKTKPTTGREEMLGAIGTTDTKIDPEGQILVRGERWNVYSDKKIKKGEKVEVIDVDGLTLKVKKHERR
ncbi:MAG: nodulation protein NfeD [Methanomicrobia archaeon]|nr:nodulation protein NfeD [Methanomicrobia archaeon]